MAIEKQLTPRQVAELLQVTAQQVRWWLNEGLFPGAYSLPTRKGDVAQRPEWRIPESGYLKFLEKHCKTTKKS